MRSLLVVLLVARVAAAQSAAGDDIAISEQKFQEARKLHDAGHEKEACDRFTEALYYNPNAVGTILNVALCKEHSGAIASAYKLFIEARDRGREQRLTEHAAAAEQHVQSLQDRVPRVTITFAEPPTMDMKLVVDDALVPTRLARSLPVDPGRRTIVVTAPNRVPYATSIEIKEGASQTVEVPALGYPTTISRTRRTIGKTLTIGGSVVAASSLALGYWARRRYDAQFDMTNPDNPPGDYCVNRNGDIACGSTSYSNLNSARQLGNVATGVFIGGAVVAVAGVALWMTAPSESSERRVVIAPSVSAEHAAIVAVGRF